MRGLGVTCHVACKQQAVGRKEEGEARRVGQLLVDCPAAVVKSHPLGDGSSGTTWAAPLYLGQQFNCVRPFPSGLVCGFL